MFYLYFIFSSFPFFSFYSFKIHELGLTLSYMFALKCPANLDCGLFCHAVCRVMCLMLIDLFARASFVGSFSWRGLGLVSNWFVNYYLNEG